MLTDTGTKKKRILSVSLNRCRTEKKLATGLCVPFVEISLRASFYSASYFSTEIRAREILYRLRKNKNDFIFKHFLPKIVEKIICQCLWIYIIEKRLVSHDINIKFSNKFIIFLQLFPFLIFFCHLFSHAIITC